MLTICGQHPRMGRPPLNLTRMHVNLSDEVIERMDAVVGAKGRSKFIREAIDQQLNRLAPLPARSGPPYTEFVGHEVRLTPSGTTSLMRVIAKRGFDKVMKDLGFTDPFAFLHCLLGITPLPPGSSSYFVAERFE